MAPLPVPPLLTITPFLFMSLFFLFSAPEGASPCSQLSATAAFRFPCCHAVALDVVIHCHSCAHTYKSCNLLLFHLQLCVWLVQGWENIDGAALQLCAACNLPWLDTSFQLAPDAKMDSGAFLLSVHDIYLGRAHVQTPQIVSATYSDCKTAAVPLEQ